MKNKFYFISLLICVLIALIGIIFQWVWYLYLIALPIIFLGISDLSQTKHSLKYNFHRIDIDFLNSNSKVLKINASFSNN